MSEENIQRVESIRDYLIEEQRKKYLQLFEDEVIKIINDTDMIIKYYENKNYNSKPQYIINLQKYTNGQLLINDNTSTVIYKTSDNELVSLSSRSFKSVIEQGYILGMNDDYILVLNVTKMGFNVYNHNLDILSSIVFANNVKCNLCPNNEIFCRMDDNESFFCDIHGNILRTVKLSLENIVEYGHFSILVYGEENQILCYDLKGNLKYEVISNYINARLWNEYLIILERDNILIYSIIGGLIKSIPIKADNITCDAYDIYYAKENTLHKLNI